MHRQSEFVPDFVIFESGDQIVKIETMALSS